MAEVMARTFAQVPDSIRFVDDAGVLRITGVARSTRRNWASHGLVPDPQDGHYRESDVVETAIVGILVSATKGLDDAQRLWTACREAVLEAAFQVSDGAELSLVFEPRLLRAKLAKSDAEIGQAARPLEPLVVIPLASLTNETRNAFWKFAVTSRTRPDGRRREARTLRPTRSRER